MKYLNIFQTLGKPDEVRNTIVPCILEGLTDGGLFGANFNNLLSGNIGPFLHIWGCATDCVSKKVGVVDNDYEFQSERFKELLDAFGIPEDTQNFVNTCSRKIGKSKCKTTGQYYYCIVNIILKKILSM